MNLVDVVILVLLALSALLGFRSGFIQSICSLMGLIVGIAVASWHYQRFASELAPMVHSQALANAIWFCLIALAVMLAAGVLGMLLRGFIRGVGLGWLDSLIGLVFGLIRGAVLATLCIVVMAAFFPDTRWLGDARLARYFLGMSHLTTEITPDELKLKIEVGLRALEKNTQRWLDEK
jgi:membrane protein required for colicin V production